MNKPLVKWTVLIFSVIAIAFSVGSVVYTQNALANARVTLSQIRNTSCDISISLPKTDSGGGAIVVEDLINCKAVSEEKLAQAEYSLSHRAEWYVLYSDNPFQIWYNGKLSESDRQENIHISEDWPYKRKVVFYTWSDLDGIDGVKLMSCDNPVEYPTVKDDIVYIYPCSK